MKFEIIPYPQGEGEGGTLYTYHVSGRTDNEHDRFLTDPVIKEAPDFPIVRDRLQRMIEKKASIMH